MGLGLFHSIIAEAANTVGSAEPRLSWGREAFRSLVLIYLREVTTVRVPLQRTVLKCTPVAIFVNGMEQMTYIRMRSLSPQATVNRPIKCRLAKRPHPAIPEGSWSCPFRVPPVSPPNIEKLNCGPTVIRSHNFRHYKSCID